MANSIKQQLTEDLETVKLQSHDRIKRIRTIAKTAFSEAISEVKAGGQEVKLTSQQSLNKVIQTVAPSDPTEAIVTVTPAEEHTVAEAMTDTSSESTTEKLAESTAEPPAESSVEWMAAQPLDSNTMPETSDAANDSASGSGHQPHGGPEATVETPKLAIVQALLKVAGLKAKSLAQGQYSKFKTHWPEHSAQIHSQTDRWDQQLTQRYGEDYTELKTGLKQSCTKAVDWYQDKLEQGKAIKPQPLERKQAQKAEELSEFGVKVAQKEAAVKQQMGQVLKTITVNVQP